MSAEQKPVVASFADKTLHSEVFTKLFRSGMDLVEDTAAYLDGQGKTDAQKLSRPAQLAYASATILLTTHIMKYASWLLAHRSIAENNGMLAECEELPQVSTNSIEVTVTHPQKLQEIIARANTIGKEIQRLNHLFHPGMN